MTTGIINYGDQGSREMSERLAGYFASTTLLAALPAQYRCHGQMAIVAQTVYVFDENATVGGVAPAAGSGRWVAPGSGAATPKVLVARNATTGAIGAYTRTGNSILADAVGALGAIDGVTNVVGDILFLNTGAAAAADVGLYAITAVGAAGAKFAMTRIPEFDSSAEVVPGTLVAVAEGTANADTLYVLSTNAPITLNSTGLTFVAVPNYVDLAATGGAALVGSTGPSTVQADINARPTAVTLALTTGAATVGSVGPSTVQADITALQALAHHTYASRVIGFADIAALGAFVTGFIDFAAALPANAIVIGSYVNVTAIVDNVTDTATLTCDVGIAGTVNLLLDGVSLNGVAVLGAPLGTIPTGYKGAITVRVTIDSDVNLNTITKGSFAVHVVYIVGP